MAEVVDNSLRFLSQDDIGAMATYLRSVPSRAASGQLAVAEAPAGQAQPPKDIRADSGGGALGLRVFEGAWSADTTSTAAALSRNLRRFSARERSMTPPAPMQRRRSCRARTFTQR